MTPENRIPEFVELFARYAKRIYAFIRVLVPQQADADDIFQATSLVLWEKFSEFRPQTDFRAWAFKIAKFKVLESRRSAITRVAHFNTALEETLESYVVADDEAFDARFRALADCFQKLPSVDRDLVDARYQPGATTKSVAEQLQCSTHAIYRALRRIHKTLFKCIRRSLEAG